jgi:hypothetical protein
MLTAALQNLLNWATRRPGFVQASFNPLSDFGDFRSHWLRQTKLFLINITAEITLTQYRTTFITTLSVNLKMLHAEGYSWVCIAGGCFFVALHWWWSKSVEKWSSWTVNIWHEVWPLNNKNTRADPNAGYPHLPSNLNPFACQTTFRYFDVVSSINSFVNNLLTCCDHAWYQKPKKT